MRILFCFLFFLIGQNLQAQTDSTVVTGDSTDIKIADTALRIINLSPYFTLHADSTLSYPLEINREARNYYWYVKNAPVGLRINKDNGLLIFKADKSYFLSGKLKYDLPYKVNIGVQNLNNVADKVDTSFTILFYNTEIIPSKLRPTIGGTVSIEEGETLAFIVQCDAGSFPIEQISFNSNRTLQNASMVSRCNEEFRWKPEFDFVKETDSAKTKIVLLSFVGTTKFGVKDTASIRVVVRDALNYPLAVEEYRQLRKNIEDYVLQLKYSFLQVDRRIKKNKNTRTTFDLTTAVTSLSGTILNSASSSDAQKAGKILPSVGLSLVPIKEAVASNKNVEQNQAGQLRNSIKRLEYMLNDNELVGDPDPEISKKTAQLKQELKQAQIQLIDVPLVLTTGMTPDELDRYFNSNKVNKKYRLKK